MMRSPDLLFLLLILFVIPQRILDLCSAFRTMKHGHDAFSLSMDLIVIVIGIPAELSATIPAYISCTHIGPVIFSHKHDIS